jgi:hypothetical protein
MMLHEAFFVYLTAHPLVGGLVGTRLYPQLIPENALLPAMAYQQISLGDDAMAHDGPLNVVTTTFQFTCQAETYNAAQTMVAALRNALHGFSGPMGNEEHTLKIFFCQQVGKDEDSGIEDAAIIRCDYKFIYMEE